jgi:hypothetical protein
LNYTENPIGRCTYLGSLGCATTNRMATPKEPIKL